MGNPPQPAAPPPPVHRHPLRWSLLLAGGYAVLSSAWHAVAHVVADSAERAGGDPLLMDILMDAASLAVSALVLLAIVYWLLRKSQAQDRAVAAGQRLLRAVIDVLPQAIYVKGLDGRFLLGNARAAAQHGLTLEQYVGRRFGDLPDVGPERAARALEHDQRVLATGRPSEDPAVEFTRPDGSPGVRRVYKAPLLDERGRVSAVVGVAEDITERRQQEERLRQSEERYRSLVEGSIQGITIVQDWQRVYCNRAFAEMLGHERPEELIGKPVSDWLSPEVRQARRAHSHALLRGEIEPTLSTFSGRHRSGRDIWVQALSQVVSWEGRPALQATYQDITDRHRQEEQLRQSEQRFRDLVEGSIQGVVITTENRIVFCNPAFARIFGYDDPQELLGRSHIDELTDPEDRARLHAYREARYAGLPAPTHHDYRGVRRDGTRIWLERQPQLIQWQGAPAVLAAVMDITERKRAEEALRQSEERFRGLVENSIQGISIVQDGRRVFCNRAFAEMLGYQRPENLTNRNDIKWVAPQDAERLRAHREALLRGDVSPVRHTFTAVRRDGTQFWVDALTQVVPWEGRPALQAACIDVTERHSQEEQRRQSEERYRNLVEHSIQGITIVQDDRRVFCNRAYAEMLGYERPEELIGRATADWVAPEDLERLRSRREAILRGAARPGRIVVHGIRRDGREIWVEALGQVVTWEGRPALQTAMIDITDRHRQEEQLAQSEERYRNLVERSIQGISIIQDWRRVFCNRAFAEMLGYERPEELIGQHSIGWVAPQERERARARAEALLRGEARPESHTFAGLRRNGTQFWVEALTQVVAWEGRPALQVACIDVTRSHELEQQLQQSQKLEAIGSLAGGVAHDFNNMLSVILSYTDFVAEALPRESPAQADLAEVRKAGQRAAGLTRQLLAFSRRQVLELRVLDLNTVVGEMERMLRRLIGEDIELVTLLDPGLASIKADPSQIEQIIMNLAVNARDAMPTGGTLTIATTNEHLDAQYAQAHVAMRPGDYVRLTISDTGIGMEESVRARIFEPFFTTKEMGKGTGLGLSTVYGIVKQMGGSIWVYSEPGQGTAFKLYFPVVADLPASTRSPGQPIAGSRGRETILVVEDDAGVRSALCRILRNHGYPVIEAAAGAEALRLREAQPGPIQLLLTDVVMPAMSGRELAQIVQRRWPATRVVYMSGYTDDAIVRHGVEQGMAFLEKPFTAQTVLRKIRHTLDEP
ncbi:MAG: PAS domain S-box protein [Candidatus Lambdaproteobacteria bacterium]|nr:PAS domain S-box protein [Candidatus Lambdaproteobacteria bacterium]